MMAVRPSAFYHGSIPATEAWIQPTPDVDDDKPATYYTVYDASERASGGYDGRVWLGIVPDLDDLGEVIFATWFPAVARAVSDVVAASIVAERSAT